MDAGFKVPTAHSKTAYLYEKGMKADRLADILREANAARDNGDTVLVAKMNKNKKFQKEQLAAEGYTDFIEFYNEEMKR